MRIRAILPTLCAIAIIGAFHLVYEREGDDAGGADVRNANGRSNGWFDRAGKATPSKTEPVVPISPAPYPTAAEAATSRPSISDEGVADSAPIAVESRDNIMIDRLRRYQVDPSILKGLLNDPSKREMAREVTRDFFIEYAKLQKTLTWEQQYAASRYIKSVGPSGMIIIRDDAHYHNLIRQMEVPYVMVSDENKRYMFDLGIVGDSHVLDVRHKTLTEQERLKRVYLAFLSGL